jgi:hypothetical protein
VTTMRGVRGWGGRSPWGRSRREAGRRYESVIYCEHEPTSVLGRNSSGRLALSMSPPAPGCPSCLRRRSATGTQRRFRSNVLLDGGAKIIGTGASSPRAMPWSTSTCASSAA